MGVVSVRATPPSSSVAILPVLVSAAVVLARGLARPLAMATVVQALLSPVVTVAAMADLPVVLAIARVERLQAVLLRSGARVGQA